MEIVAKENNIRLDQYLTSELDISRSKIQKLIKEDRIFVNDRSVNASHMIHENDLIIIDDDLSFDIHIEPEDIDVDIVYEDDYLLIVNKKSGMVVHPAPGNYTGTLVNALMGRFRLSNKDNVRPGIVHRIDKDTSGLLVVAKNDCVHDKLSEMIKNKEIERIYIALVDGVINHETGTIDAPIGRDINNRQKMMVTDLNGKDAITHFRVLKRYSNKTLIECKLETGRTHQIRVHMNYILHPIVNDPVYGKSKKTTSFGQMLHSKSIRFIHPVTKKEIYIESNLPEEFASCLEQLEKEDN